VKLRFRDDDGQVLILALVFVSFAGLLIGALLNFVNASVLGTQQLKGQRSAAYAADSATDAAINVARADRSIGAYGATPCMKSSSFTMTEPDGTVATVDCSSLANALDTDRTIQFTASVDGAPTVRARVVFHDSAAPSGLPIVEVQSWTYCGHDAGACP
jgi:hypothetical protein